ILGICYGEQLLNIHYGGTLDQDVTIRENAVDHGKSEQAAMHRVTFSEDFLGYSKGQQITVAARHHQAVATLAPGFVAVAYADDGCIEAIAGNGHVGVQWHSESDNTAPQIYGQFIQRCILSSQVKVPVKKVAKPNVVTQLMARMKR
ncbi:MAG: gamma-glutamyl-gamma-aminobutyrate hydrolase family protein, partial [Candidatus Saccharimonadales bacterium]